MLFDTLSVASYWRCFRRSRRGATTWPAGWQSVHASAGFTLLELIVTIFVIAILSALTLAAIQAARASARKARCASNLHQLGLALHAYHANVGTFPQAANGLRGYSVHAMILADLNSTTIFNAMNFQVDPITRPNRTALSAPLAVFLCPSDSSNGRPCSSYAANSGYGYQRFNGQFNGAFVAPPNKPTTLASFIDGSSNTALMAEWVLGSGKKTLAFNPLGSVFYTRTLLIKPSEFDDFMAACQRAELDRQGRFFAGKGAFWIEGSCGMTLYNHNIPVNGNSCLNRKRFLEGAWTASSYHGSGVNVLMADGHGAFVTRSVAVGVWRAIATRDGAEVVGSLE